MTSTKARTAVAGSALLVAVLAVTAVLTLGGGNAGKANGTAKVRAAEQSPAASGGAGETPDGAAVREGSGQAPTQGTLQTAADLYGILGQLEQAVASGRQPRPLTREEVATWLRSELQKVGINQP